MCVDIVNISEWPTQMSQAIKKAFRRLRAALSKIKRRCIAAVKALRPEATCPPEGCTAKAGGTQVEHLCDEEQRRPLQEEMPTTGHKKVTFSEKVEVRPLVAWAFASRVARDGSCWLQMARDRDRFRRRVEAASDVIGPVLLPQHRAAVWERLGRGSSTSSRHQYREDSE
ncbi:uncharacterized protein [Paramormyrops kingsleyae]|uniref:uncharacterized protein isoform X2 n=1 Tax=Paramormyrops kingsleyae TaxID=1676925 RepID=UPI003B972B1F